MISCAKCGVPLDFVAAWVRPSTAYKYFGRSRRWVSADYGGLFDRMALCKDCA